MPALSSYVRIRCISYWMQNICLLLSDIFHVLPAYIQAWKGTDRIRYPVSLFRNAGLRLSPSGSDPPHILRHSLRKAVAELMLEILPLVLYLFMI